MQFYPMSCNSTLIRIANPTKEKKITNAGENTKKRLMPLTEIKLNITAITNCIKVLRNLKHVSTAWYSHTFLDLWSKENETAYQRNVYCITNS